MQTSTTGSNALPPRRKGTSLSRVRLYLVGGALRSVANRDALAGELLDALDEHAIVSVADLEGRIVYANDKFCEISGYSRDELVGRTHRIVKSSAHSNEFYADLWATISSGKIWHGEFENRAKGGQTYWVSSTIVPVLDEQGIPERYVSIRTDITRQKSLERRVRDQHQFLLQVTEAIGEGVLVTDDKGRCTFASGEALRLLRKTEEEVLGWSVDGLLVGPLETLGVRADAVPDGPASDRTIKLREGRFHASFVRGDGRRLLAAMHVKSMGPRRARRGFVIVFRDNKADRREKSEAQRLAEQTETASKAKSTFLAHLSHEVRTPLNGILGLVRLARSDPHSARSADYLAKLEDLAKSLADLVSDVLDLSKIEAGKLSLESVPYDVRELLHAVWEAYQALAQEKGLSLELLIDSAVPVAVLGDPMRLRQIAVNFLTNSLKFTERGTIELRASMESPAGAPSASLLRIEVADTGIGLQSVGEAALFQPFMQADASTSRRYGGSGLGLSICRELAHQMRGEVGAQNRESGGALFWVEIPIELAERPVVSIPGPGPGPGLPPSDLSGLRVLLVEDNEVNQIIATAMLEQWGCVVTVAHNGQDAIDALRACGSVFDAIVMDMQMPVMDGREAVTAIRRDPLLASLPIIAVTATATPGERQECLALGMNGYVTKPINGDELRATIARLTGRGQATRA